MASQGPDVGLLVVSAGMFNLNYYQAVEPNSITSRRSLDGWSCLLKRKSVDVIQKTTEMFYCIYVINVRIIDTSVAAGVKIFKEFPFFGLFSIQLPL